MTKQSKITAAITPIIEHLELDDLTISDLNPRKSVSEEGIELLAQSLVACGLIQNLAGVKDKHGKVAIVAGGRRLRALQIAVKSRPDLALVPVRMAPDMATATEWANAENTAREDLDPVDEIRAYGKMAEQNHTVGKISLAFGVTEAHVRRRLALAHLPDPVLVALQSGEISLGMAQAFTVSSNETLILEVLDMVQNGYMNEYGIKSKLNPQSVDSTNRMARFVGVEAYQAEGGSLTCDLFEDEVLLNDPDILGRIFSEKLAQEAAAFKATESWAWVTVSDEASPYWYDLQRQNGFARIYKIEGTLEEQEAARYDELAESDDLDEAGKLELEKFDAMLEGEYSAAQKAVAGAIVYVKHDGTIGSLCGLVKADDIEEAIVADILEASKHDEKGDVPKPKPAYSQKFRQDMTAIRLAAVQTALLDKPEFVLDLLAFCLSPASGYSHDTLALRFDNEQNCPSVDEAFSLHKRLGGELGEAEKHALNQLHQQSYDDTGDAFRTFRAQGKKSSNAQIVESFARAFKTQEPAFMAEIEGEAGADIRAIWTPNAANCFSRLKGAQLEALFMSMLDLNPESDSFKRFAKAKKGEKNAILEALFNDPTAQKVRGVTPDQKVRIEAWVPDCF